MRIAIACGGTGGHLYPGLATARVLQGWGHSVTLWLSGRSTEDVVRKEWDGPVVSIAARGFEQTFGMAALASSFRLAYACLVACRIMHRERPDVVLGMGSYASVAAVAAAAFWHVPIVLHEANAVPGRAVDLLSRFAHDVALAFPEAGSMLKRRRTTVTGLPLRPGVLPEEQDVVSSRENFQVLIMGGSQGAQRLNEQASQGICLLHRKGLRFPVVHLCGETDVARMEARYKEAGVEARVFGFLSDMRVAYRGSRYAIARSGAASVMELAVWGIPALFVPLPEARRNHQLVNAGALRDAGAAGMIRQAEMTASAVADHIAAILDDRSKLAKMQKAIRRFAVTDGAEKLAALVENVGSRTQAEGRT